MKKIITLILLTLCMQCVSAAPQKLMVVLDWFINPDHAPLVIAKQQGYFKEQGLEVELIGPADPTDAPKWVAAGKADIGITYEPDLMQQVDQGLPLISFGTLIDKPLDCIVALQESGIKSIADLKGKRIGSVGGGNSSVMLKTMLEKAGLKLSDVELINVKYNLTQALLSHKIDAATGMMRNFEVPQIESTGHKVEVFFPEEHGVPTYSVLVFIANKNKINDPRLPKFLAAIKKAVAYLDQHPKEAWKEFAKKYPEANNNVNREAWFTTMPYFAEEPAMFEADDWENFAKFMFANNMIKSIKPVSQYAVKL